MIKKIMKSFFNALVLLTTSIILIALFLLLVYAFSFVYNFLLNNFYIITITFVVSLVVLFIYYLKIK